MGGRDGEKKLLAAKLKDTGVIYRAFEKYLENRYVTAEDVLEVLAGKLEESALIKNSEVLVDGFTGFTPVQIGVLGKLFRLCAKVYVTIIMDEREDPYKKAIPHQLFAMSRQLVQQLMKAADEAGCPVEPEIWVRRSGHGRFQPGSTMDQLEQRLFRYGKRGFSGNGIEKDQNQERKQRQEIRQQDTRRNSRASTSASRRIRVPSWKRRCV